MLGVLGLGRTSLGAQRHFGILHRTVRVGIFRSWDSMYSTHRIRNTAPVLTAAAASQRFRSLALGNFCTFGTWNEQKRKGLGMRHRFALHTWSWESELAIRRTGCIGLGTHQHHYITLALQRYRRLAFGIFGAFPTRCRLEMEEGWITIPPA